jgi:hypothetical protein
MPLSISAMGTSVGELQRDYLFLMQITELPEGFTDSEKSVGKLIDCFLTKGIFPSRKTAEIAVKWGGQTSYFSGVDESPKTGDMVFRLDEAMFIKDLFERLQTLTGDEASHAAAAKANQTSTFKVYLVDRSKQFVTDAKQLNKVIVYSVEDLNLDKEGSGIQTFKVHISWDTSQTLADERGSTISSSATGGLTLTAVTTTATEKPEETPVPDPSLVT